MKLTRRCVIGVMTVVALLNGLLAVHILLGPEWTRIFDRSSKGGRLWTTGVAVRSHLTILKSDFSHEPFPGGAGTFQTFAYSGGRGTGQQHDSGRFFSLAVVRIPWTTFAGIALLFGILPLRSLIRGPLRTRYRRRRGLCLKCGYNLTGNLSGVCPECGNPHTTTG